MSKKTKRTIKNFKSFIAITLAILALFMALYSLIIAGTSQMYTRNIAQARLDATSYHPSTRQDYENQVYLEESAKRDALYESNAYTKWFFGLNATWMRALVIVGWLAIPALIVGWAILKIWVEYLIAINAPSVSRRCY